MMFADQIERTMEVYIDDMLVKYLDAGDHTSHLQQSFSTLRKYNMKLNPAKCSFDVSSGKFLGLLRNQSLKFPMKCLLSKRKIFIQKNRDV